MNGQKIGDHILDPGQSVYDERVLYVGHNVTQVLKPGATVGVRWWMGGCFNARSACSSSGSPRSTRSTHSGVSDHCAGWVAGVNAIGALLGNSKWGYLDIYANRTAAVSILLFGCRC